MKGLGVSNGGGPEIAYNPLSFRFRREALPKTPEVGFSFSPRSGEDFQPTANVLNKGLHSPFAKTARHHSRAGTVLLSEQAKLPSAFKTSRFNGEALGSSVEEVEFAVTTGSPPCEGDTKANPQSTVGFPL
jgi:hypothetical protein